MNRRSMLIICVLLVLVATGIVAAQEDGETLYRTAVELAVAGKWETALYAFDRVQSTSQDSSLRAKALAWKTLIAMGMESANRSLAIRLEKALERGLTTERTNLLRDAGFYRAAAEKWHVAWVADIRKLISIEEGRWLEIDLPAGYSLRIPPERTHVDSSLQYGLYPGQLSLLVYRDFSVSVMIPITFEHATYVGLADEIIRGKAMHMLVDLAKLYLHAATICTPTERDLRQACLERVLALTCDEPYSTTRLDAERLLKQ